MSGICGILRLDGGPPGGIEAMAALLERRGPEGTHIWRDGPVALGHTLLATTPEALHETLPLTDPATGCTITADARLDNREELLAALGLSGPRVIGDGELLLRAYVAWGESCLDRFLGDFAFAIWDPRRQAVFAARDQMGMRQLAYAHVPGRVLAFATEPRAVIEAEGVPRGIDEGRVADFLSGHMGDFEVEATLFEAVRRLPAAHVLTADASGVALRRYWSLTPGPPLRLGSDEAYAEAFLDVFTEAVRCRLRSAGPVGSMLSGGMDSGSVAAVAARLLQVEGRGPLLTFSVTGPSPGNAPEAAAIRANLSIPGIEPRVLDLADPSGWMGELCASLRTIDEPFDCYLNIPRLAYLAARREGLKVVLDGMAGDNVLSEGDRLAHLLRQGQLLKALREVRVLDRVWNGGESWRRNLHHAVRRAAVPHGLRRLKHRLKRKRDARPTSAILSPAFARQVDLAGRVARWRRIVAGPLRPAPWDRVDELLGPVLVGGREGYDNVAGACGIEPRDPFMDLRVIDFCLRCPADQMMSGGWFKVILRRSMRGLLPDEVVWRSGRWHFGADLMRALRSDPRLALDGRLSPSGNTLAFLGRVTGLSHGQALSGQLKEGEEWEYRCLALWLEALRAGPPKAPDSKDE